MRDNAKKGMDDIIKGTNLLMDVDKNLTDYLSMIDTKVGSYALN